MIYAQRAQKNTRQAKARAILEYKTEKRAGKREAGNIRVGYTREAKNST